MALKGMLEGQRARCSGGRGEEEEGKNKSLDKACFLAFLLAQTLLKLTTNRCHLF